MPKNGREHGYDMSDRRGKMSFLLIAKHNTGFGEQPICYLDVELIRAGCLSGSSTEGFTLEPLRQDSLDSINMRTLGWHIWIRITSNT